MKKAIIFLPIIFLMFASCGMDEKHDMGYIKLSLNDTNARTIMPPSPKDDVVEYKLVFTNTSTSTTLPDIIRNSSELTGLIPLNPGNYDLVVTAYAAGGIAGGIAVAAGELTGINIIAGKWEEYTIVLRPVSDNGTGTFKWDITFASSLTMTAASMTIELLSDNTVKEDIDLIADPDGSLPLASGQYSLLFELTEGIAPDSLTIYWREVLHIYQNLESDFKYEFTEDHFNGSGCSVTFAPNDGTAMRTEHVLYNSVITKPADPDGTTWAGLTGYKFDGWYRDNLTFENEYDFTSKITDDITLYAKWIPITCTIKYDANGGTGNIADSVVTYAQANKLRANNFTMTGYAFTGWNTEIDGSGYPFADAQDITNLNILDFDNAGGSVTLYAQWQICQFTVTYNLANGIGTVPAPQTEDYDTPITLPDDSGFSRTGYVFAGWNTITNILKSPYAAGSQYTIPSQDIVMYAQWSKSP